MKNIHLSSKSQRNSAGFWGNQYVDGDNEKLNYDVGNVDDQGQNADESPPKRSVKPAKRRLSEPKPIL